MIGPQRFQALDLGRARRARNDFAARELRELYAAAADAAGGAENQHFFTGLHAADRVHHAQRCPVRDRQARRIFVRDAVRQRDQVMRRHFAELGEPAVRHLADQPGVVDSIHGIDQHPVALLPRLDCRTRRDDFAGEIDAHDAGHRHLDAGHAAPRKEVVVVERGRAHAHDDVVRARYRVGKVRFDIDRACAAVLVYDCCFHVLFFLKRKSKSRRRTHERARSRARRPLLHEFRRRYSPAAHA